MCVCMYVCMKTMPPSGYHRNWVYWALGHMIYGYSTVHHERNMGVICIQS